MVQRSSSRFLFLVILLFILSLISLGAAIFLLMKPPSPGDGKQEISQSTQLIPPEIVSSPTPTAKPSPPSTPVNSSPQAFAVTIIDGENQKVVETTALTVAEALAGAGVALGPGDRVEPPPASPLKTGTTIHIARSIPLTVLVDGQIFHIQSTQLHVGEILAELGIILGENDQVDPELTAELQAGDTIEVLRGSEEFIFSDEEIPFQTIYQPSEDLDLDTKATLSAGSPGIMRRRTRLIYEDGIEVGQVVEEEWVEREPVNQVIGYGTRVNLGVIDTPEGPREYWRVVRMRVTAYTAASSGKAPDHPSYGITASGLPAGTGIVAVDPNVIPFRSEVFVPGYGIGFAGDTGGGVKGRWIDLGYDEEELVAWNGYVDVYYLTPLPAEINYLLPEVIP